MTNKPDAIIFFDLDGTLLTSDVTVAKTTIEAINNLHNNNIMPVIATGRTVCEVQHIMKQSKIDSIVAMNGQSVFYQGSHVFSNNIDISVIDRVMAYSKTRTNIPLSFYNDKIMRISELSKPAIKFYNFLKQPVPPVDSDIYRSEPIQMLLLLCEDGEEEYIKQFPELCFIRNTQYCVDVFNRGGSKAFGIKKLLENKKLLDVPTYAFGDGLNDLEMFELVDHPIAMGNAVTPLKKLAEFITDDHNNDGIAKGLKHFSLI
ncbi:Cof-type HAD-IIB family hydrolase [Orbus sturtevantii]|uniref:Cof-type HAD-IIB family hydrolase n=1 Tax=Orbus sturtevantii TaxID=3074109 RepID=UPI00370D4237